MSNFFLFFCTTVKYLARRPSSYAAVAKELLDFAYCALPIVGVTAFFTGAVLVIQGLLGYTNMSTVKKVIPGISAIAIIRELGPLITGLVIAGRNGASITAKLGVMRISGQIDACITLGVDPIWYFVTPKVFASIIASPILMCCTVSMGILGSLVSGMLNFQYDLHWYINALERSITSRDMLVGLIKTFAFGFIVSTISCYCGYNCGYTSKTLGYAVAKNLIITSLLMIVANYFVTYIFL